MHESIAQMIRERGLLVEKDIFDMLQKLQDSEMASAFLETLEKVAGQKLITSGALIKNINVARKAVSEFAGDKKDEVKKIFVQLGVQLEFTEKKEEGAPEMGKTEDRDFEIFSPPTEPTGKLAVGDFIGHFRSRYHQLQRMLLHRPGLENLTSINKISSTRQGVSVIGMVSEKRVTNNKNLIITLQDLTGQISALAKQGSEAFAKAADIQNDDVVAVKASGNNELLFIQDVLFPEAHIPEKTYLSKDECVVFLSDVHAGSDKHLGEEFQRFLHWLNSSADLAKKVKYIFLVGDNVDGVGVFPGQERVLAVKRLKEQYDLLASYLRQVPSHIEMFMCPGQHDSVRVAEPQPPIDSYYGESLYGIDNLHLVPNPSYVHIKDGNKRFKILMYHGASIHSFINNIEELRTLKAHRCPAKAVVHMLKRRHLAPTHSEHGVVYVPNSDKDALVIDEVPDVLCTGEVHRVDVERYNNVLIMTGSCWQSQTDFEEKIGNFPDPCKVPVLNLSTQELKVLDFGG